MWSHSLIHDIIQTKNAHLKLMEKRCTTVNHVNEWINGYEFGLFMSTNVATIMAETLHIHGMIMEDAVSPYIHQIAFVKGYVENIKCMQCIVWNVDVLRGIIRRPDAYSLLLTLYGTNGYEYALMHDLDLSKEIGKLLRHYEVQVSSVVRHCVFKQSPKRNIKAMLSS